MVCGRCWKAVAKQNPHYRYGGLWKNRTSRRRGDAPAGDGEAPAGDADEDVDERLLVPAGRAAG